MVTCQRRPQLPVGLRYLIEIWCADRFWPSQTSAVNKPAIRSRFATTWPPSWKSIWRHSCTGVVWFWM